MVAMTKMENIREMKKFGRYVWMMGIVLVLAACEPGPQDIRIGEQECDHCRMMISDERFASQLVTEKGRQYAFDAIECMAAFVDGGEGQSIDIHSLWVPDFERPGEWLVAEEAYYLQSDELRSPMALNFSAYETEDKAEQQQNRFSGSVMDWHELGGKVHEAWSNGH